VRGSGLRAAVALASDRFGDELACCSVLIEECSRDVGAASDGSDGYFRVLVFHLLQCGARTIERGCGGGMTGVERGFKCWVDGLALPSAVPHQARHTGH